ncbi:hypothetical protein [Nonomuraea turcica]|uniref:hypothetical protein n=1 Tax=Nonomuraea sp. G32 TaxID=3067274 RepID=UPI00273CED63|nr:hypothetical protein [Nonomuraea sp. G32]MDP4501019.1 hypothetical protein [Nonomuraea sp. G32]
MANQAWAVVVLAAIFALAAAAAGYRHNPHRRRRRRERAQAAALEWRAIQAAGARYHAHRIADNPTTWADFVNEHTHDSEK